MLQVYLSGPIDEADEEGARGWREEAKVYLCWRPDYGIKCLDPLRGKDGSIDKADYTPAELVLRDMEDIRQATVVLCHFAPKGTYQTWGTPGECALAAYFRKPVVFVCGEDSPLRKHPWSRFQAVRFFSDLEKACAYIVEMWG